MNARPAMLNQVARTAATFALCLTWASVAFCGPIHDATRKGNEAKVIALLKENPDLVSRKDKLGNTPLHIAALHNQVAIAALLLANDADVNAQTVHGETPLTLALLSFHHKEMLELLLTHGADPNAFNQGTPLQRAIERDIPYDVELLLANGADPDLGSWSAVHMAIMHGRTKILEILLDYGANPNTIDGAGHTPMYYAENGYRSYYGESSSNQRAIEILRAHGGHK